MDLKETEPTDGAANRTGTTQKTFCVGRRTFDHKDVCVGWPFAWVMITPHNITISVNPFPAWFLAIPITTTIEKADYLSGEIERTSRLPSILRRLKIKYLRDGEPCHTFLLSFDLQGLANAFREMGYEIHDNTPSNKHK